ncbi:TetR/AcrR family transcriptional regulator [Azohydromonas caseinilytica]|uniref:TetR/AcrR family transcriptional regulator n=1 Tax=Azohydromonas caseinilytica TaxID=2728836 RepID=A0A848FM84_9BURK|nr:TetR/AcrR family transcriptional regulator [Azohydromonas caseinilytica]NML18881.1 TetR/AcrR family transcriptional regulator [Azohydromonas caseinilytica]
MTPTSRTSDALDARPTKGRATRAAILDVALTQALHAGLEGLSIGLLAEHARMSKSGVFAHFGSREELQIAVIREYHRRFSAEVFEPALRQPRGLPRLRALFENWLERVTAELAAGCIYISGAVEFDDRPGAVRDALVDMVDSWHAALERAITLAVSEGHLRADTDPAQLRFEIHGLILAVHHDARLLRRDDAPQRARAGFNRIVERWAAPSDATAAPAARG